MSGKGMYNNFLEAFLRMTFSNRKVRKRKLADRCGIIFLKRAYGRDPCLNTPVSLGSFVN